MRAILFFCCVLMSACGGGGGTGGGSSSVPAPQPVASGSHDRSVIVGGLTRTFRVYVPSGVSTGAAVPVIYALHGRYGTGLNTQSTYGFDALSDARKIVMVYPDGYSKSWNDGRGVTPAATANVDDIAFFDAMHADLQTFITIDAARVYVCGMSNGSLMSQRLGIERASRFAAIGSVCGTLATLIPFTPSEPVSDIQFAGTADTLSVYAGGIDANGGSVLGVEALAASWRLINGVSAPITTALPNSAPADGCTVELVAADGGTDDTAVHLYRITGGGHNWPGHAGALDIGNLCLDIDATALLVEFFLDHPKQRLLSGIAN